MPNMTCLILEILPKTTNLKSQVIAGLQVLLRQRLGNCFVYLFFVVVLFLFVCLLFFFFFLFFCLLFLFFIDILTS